MSRYVAYRIQEIYIEVLKNKCSVRSSYNPLWERFEFTVNCGNCYIGCYSIWVKDV